jgi:hypothetical protein
MNPCLREKKPESNRRFTAPNGLLLLTTAYSSGLSNIRTYAYTQQILHRYEYRNFFLSSRKPAALPYYRRE